MAKNTGKGAGFLLAGLAVLGIGALVASSINIEEEANAQFASVGVPKYTGWRILLIILFSLGYTTATLRTIPAAVTSKLADGLMSATGMMQSYGLRSPVALLLIWGVNVFRGSTIWSNPTLVSILNQYRSAQSGIPGLPVAPPSGAMEPALIASLAKALLQSATNAKERVFLTIVAGLAQHDPMLQAPIMAGAMQLVPLINEDVMRQSIRPYLSPTSDTATAPIATPAAMPTLDYGNINSPGGWDDGMGYMNDGGQAWGFEDVGDYAYPQNPVTFLGAGPTHWAPRQYSFPQFYPATGRPRWRY